MTNECFSKNFAKIPERLILYNVTFFVGCRRTYVLNNHKDFIVKLNVIKLLFVTTKLKWSGPLIKNCTFRREWTNFYQHFTIALSARKNYNYIDNYREQHKKEAITISYKSNNCIRSNREKFNIAITILLKMNSLISTKDYFAFGCTRIIFVDCKVDF